MTRCENRPRASALARAAVAVFAGLSALAAAAGARASAPGQQILGELAGRWVRTAVIAPGAAAAGREDREKIHALAAWAREGPAWAVVVPHESEGGDRPAVAALRDKAREAGAPEIDPFLSLGCRGVRGRAGLPDAMRREAVARALIDAGVPARDVASRATLILGCSDADARAAASRATARKGHKARALGDAAARLVAARNELARAAIEEAIANLPAGARVVAVLNPLSVPAMDPAWAPPRAASREELRRARLLCPPPVPVTGKAPGPGVEVVVPRTPPGAGPIGMVPRAATRGHGLTRAEAIGVCMPAGERAYLSALRCPGGEAPRLRRAGSVGPRDPRASHDLMRAIDAARPVPEGEADSHHVDRYEVVCPGLKLDVYLDMYHCADPDPMRPVGPLQPR